MHNFGLMPHFEANFATLMLNCLISCANTLDLLPVFVQNMLLNVSATCRPKNLSYQEGKSIMFIQIILLLNQQARRKQCMRLTTTRPQ